MEVGQIVILDVQGQVVAEVEVVEVVGAEVAVESVAPQMVAEIPTNNANSPFGLTESLTTNALMLATNQAKLILGVQLRWIVQAIMWVVRANGELVHHHVLQEKLVCHKNILLS